MFQKKKKEEDQNDIRVEGQSKTHGSRNVETETRRVHVKEKRKLWRKLFTCKGIIQTSENCWSWKEKCKILIVLYVSARNSVKPWRKLFIHTKKKCKLFKLLIFILLFQPMENFCHTFHNNLLEIVTTPSPHDPVRQAANRWI